MKTWKQKANIPKFGICTVVEHTDKECEQPRTDGQYLAPFDHGFVCLYKNGKYVGWCGSFYAERHIIKSK